MMPRIRSSTIPQLQNELNFWKTELTNPNTISTDDFIIDMIGLCIFYIGREKQIERERHENRKSQ